MDSIIFQRHKVLSVNTSLLICYPSLVLVQTRKTRPCLTERLLMGRKESNQTKIKINMWLQLL